MIHWYACYSLWCCFKKKCILVLLKLKSWKIVILISFLCIYYLCKSKTIHRNMNVEMSRNNRIFAFREGYLALQEICAKIFCFHRKRKIVFLEMRIIFLFSFRLCYAKYVNIVMKSLQYSQFTTIDESFL